MAGSTNMPDLRTRLTLDTTSFTSGLVDARAQASIFGGAIGAVGSQFGTAATAMATFATIGVLSAGVITTAFGGAVAAVIGLGVVSAAQSEQVKTAWQVTAIYVQRDMLAAAQAFVPVLTQLAANVRTAFSQIQPALMQVFERLAPVFSNLANTLLQKFVSVVNRLPDLVNQALAVLQMVEPYFDQFLSTVGAGWHQLTQTVLQFGGAILQGALPGIGQFFSAIFSGISTVVAAASQLAGPVFSALGAVATALAHAFSGVVQAILPQLTLFGGTLKQIGLGLVTLLSGIGPPLGKIIGDLNQLGPIIAEAAKALAPTLAGLLNDAADFGQALMPVFRLIGKLLPALGPVFVELGHILVSVVGGFVQGLAPLLAQLGDTSWTQALVQGLEKIAPVLVKLATIFGSFISLVVQGFGFIINGLASLFGAFSGVVPGLSGIGQSGGKALVVGLIAGIGFLINPLLGVVGGLIAAVAAFLPHSPAQTGPLSGSGSPNARGQALGKDFAAGITSQTGTVSSAAQKLATSAAVGVNPMHGSALNPTATTGSGGLLGSFLTNLGLGGGGGGLGGIIVNVAGSILSQNELMNTIQTAALRKGQRNGGSTLATSVRATPNG